MRSSRCAPVDIVMLGSFGVWSRGTLQSRALPIARALTDSAGLRFALVTTPWDDPTQAGVQETVDGVAIYNTNATDLFHAPAVVREQLRLVRQLQPALIHVLKPKAAAGMTADLLQRSGRAPAVIVDHDDWEGDGGWNDRAGYPLPARRLFAYQERRLLGSADAVTAASTLLVERARQLRRERGDDERVVFVPNGLEESWMSSLNVAAERQRHCDHPHLVLYSRFAEFSPAWLGEVLTRIDRKLHAPLELDIIGTEQGAYPLPADLHWMQPRWHGYVPRTAIPDLLGGATIALYPYDDNLINRSKQSVKLLELMAAGVAIVASDVGDVQRIAGDGLVALRPGSAADFAGAVVKLIAAPGLAKQQGRRARQRVADYRIDRLAGRVHRLYQRFGLA